VLIFIYLTPLIPLSFKGEGEVLYKRGSTSLRLSLSIFPFKGGRKYYLGRGEAPSRYP